MWAPWLLNFHLHRRDILEDDISLEEIVAMWDGLKEAR